MRRRKKIPDTQEEDPRKRLLELGYQIKALSEMLISTAEELRKEELSDVEP